MSQSGLGCATARHVGNRAVRQSPPMQSGARKTSRFTVRREVGKTRPSPAISARPAGRPCSESRMARSRSVSARSIRRLPTWCRPTNCGWAAGRSGSGLRLRPRSFRNTGRRRRSHGQQRKGNKASRRIGSRSSHWRKRFLRIGLAAAHKATRPCETRAVSDFNDRVLMSLALAPRPPLPKAKKLEQGDWSLLDPLKLQRPFWRQTSEYEDAGQG